MSALKLEVANRRRLLAVGGRLPGGKLKTWLAEVVRICAPVATVSKLLVVNNSMNWTLPSDEEKNSENVQR